MPSSIKIYQLKIHLLDVSPMVWRRLLVKSTTSISTLHGIIQIAMGWENWHLHRFTIFGKDYGIYYDGGMYFSDDPREVLLSDFDFNLNDKFQYEYNFNISWKHQIRVEKILNEDNRKSYPRCINGKNACPPEEIGGIHHLTELRDSFHYIFYDFLKCIRFQERIGYAWRPDIFKRRIINQLLREEDYDFMEQITPLFPDRSGTYFKDKYWYKKDDFQALKVIYDLLKKQGIEVEDKSNDYYLGEPTGWKMFGIFLKHINKID